MIYCEICEDWFHGSCVSLEESDEPLIDNYVCPPCTADGKGKTTWIRKCRLQGCKNPARQSVKPSKTDKGSKPSKYCSDEHARQFFRQKLNSLDTETLAKETLKALVQGVQSVDQFKVLGDKEPPISDTILTKFKTREDESRLADLRLEREKIMRKSETVSLRQQFLHFVIEKTKITNAELKAQQPTPTSKSKIKPKELCGYDDRLSLDDAEFLEWFASEEGKRVFAERKVEEKTVHCGVEKRRCRHVGWQQLRGEDILMEESLLRGQLDGIQREENLIGYDPPSPFGLDDYGLTFGRERQKVRARNANTGNHTQVAN
jgi:COMPASS component SPP1